MTDVIQINAFLSTTFAFLVFLIGAELTRKTALLRDFNIPEPVSGGLVAALATMAVFYTWGYQIEFDLAARDYFLIVFFTGIGLNARISDVSRGGKPLAILLAITVAIILVQNTTGLLAATVFGLPSDLSVVMGSAALIGGHGTVIAWGPRVAEETGMQGVAELGIAVATLGLVAASLIGGPIARFLINRGQLHPSNPVEVQTVGIAYDNEPSQPITHITLMHTLLWVHITIVLGYSLDESLDAMGLDLPAFVPCLLMGIILGNTVPVILPWVYEVRQTPTLAVVSDFALGTFLAMSLMSLQLWTLSGLGLTLLIVMGLQTLCAIVISVFILFPAMGRNYFAAVMAAGTAGFALGATPTAIANMTAVTKRYGPSPLAFVVLPLVSAFFIDIINSFAIQAFISF
ncbi:MAG: sodium/glutamate symporter [Pseudomonadota bacterium]